MNTIDPNEFFGAIDFTADDEPKKPAKKEEKNAFAAFEEHLNLPQGSTKDALAEAQRQAREFKSKADSVKREAKMLATKEQLASNNVLQISPEVLKADRDRIRDEAFELYNSGKELFEVMKERFMATVSPTDRMCTAMATMLNSMSAALAKLLDTNTKLRSEDEHYRDVQAQNAAETMDSDKQQMTFTPESQNDIIEKWVTDFENNMQLEMETKQITEQ